MITFDVETTISNKGNPFDQTNKCVRLGVKKYKGASKLFYGYAFYQELQDIFDNENIVMGFNIKFDLHWLRRCGYKFHGKVWDCQLADFLLHNQQQPYRSLNDCLEEAGIPLKLDNAEKYWSEGIDTDKIPLEELDAYLIGDLEKTEALYMWQLPRIREAGLLPLLQLQCEDLIVLEEMEWNGIKFDTKAALARADILRREYDEITASIYDHFNFGALNLSSNDHLSAVLYGGTITESRRIPVGEYKTGAKIGQTRYKIEKVEHTFERRFKPLPKTEQKKEGYWQVSEDVLLKLKPIDKADKWLIEKLIRLSKLNKLISTYLVGWSELIDTMNWEKDSIHGNLNQCVAITGRLSSTRPNQQNADPITKEFIYSRYDKRINIDVKSLEVVCAAFLSRDETLMQEIRDGVDIHEMNRITFGFPEKDGRKTAKILKFRIIYGGSEFSFAKDPDFTPVSTSKAYWKDIIDKYYEKYSGVRKWHNNLVRQAMEGGIISPFGRKYVYHIGEKIPETQIKNHPVQGFGADIVSIIRVMLYRDLVGIDGVAMSNTVHDSIEIDCKDDKIQTVQVALKTVLRDLKGEIMRRFDVDFDLDILCEVEIKCKENTKDALAA